MTKSFPFAAQRDCLYHVVQDMKPHTTQQVKTQQWQLHEKVHEKWGREKPTRETLVVSRSLR